jgi:hypothetical protein
VIPILGLLLIAGFVAYELYDLIDLIPRYRESKQNDDTLFPQEEDASPNWLSGRLAVFSRSA